VVDLGRAEPTASRPRPGAAALARRAPRRDAAARHRLPAPLHLRLRAPCPRTPAWAPARSSRWRWAAPSAAPSAWPGQRELRALLGRGARSGVGIAGFDHGGLLLDGGPRADGSPAALLARIALPPAWRDPRARPRARACAARGEGALAACRRCPRDARPRSATRC
jgi:hypothetical protein